MVVAGQCPDVLVLVRRVPEFDGQVARAGSQERAAPWAAKVDVQHAFGVSLDGAFELAQLPVPDLDGRVFGARGERREDGVEGHACYGGAMRLQRVARGGPGQPAGGVLVAAEERGRCGRVEFALEALVALLEFQHLQDKA